MFQRIIDGPQHPRCLVGTNTNKQDFVLLSYVSEVCRDAPVQCERVQTNTAHCFVFLMLTLIPACRGIPFRAAVHIIYLFKHN